MLAQRSIWATRLVSSTTTIPRIRPTSTPIQRFNPIAFRRTMSIFTSDVKELEVLDASELKDGQQYVLPFPPFVSFFAT